MTKEKLQTVLEGIFLLVFGILIAVCGIDTTVNIYFGVVFTAVGACALLLIIALLIKKAPIIPALFFMAGIGLTVGICLFTNWLSFSALIPLLIAVILGAGAGLVVHGLYMAIKVNVIYGIGELVIGAAIMTLALVYMYVPDFQKPFWIITGILVAVYGAFTVVFGLIKRK
ncbi:MAG: hypothetical protein K5906_04470 [Bacilli bacterium]|nr:hypothetical protein [Bacilli bacterium]